MSPANLRLIIFLPPMLTFPSCSEHQTEKMLKRMGDEDILALPFSNAVIHMDCTCSLVIELVNDAHYIFTDIELPHGSP